MSRATSVIVLSLALLFISVTLASQTPLERRLNRILRRTIATLSDEATFPATRCTNVDSSLNVRDINMNVVKSLGPETQVTVYEVITKNGKKWARIGNNQYVSADYLKMACNNNGGGQSAESKAKEALVEIFKSEGKCQNWSSDSGNHFEGKIGYTCMGIIPSVAWGNRNGAFKSLLSGFNGHPADFCKYAYDKNQNLFKEAAAQVYEQNYFKPGGCNPLPQPAFYVCADIAVNSGVGRSQQYLREFSGLNPNADPKGFARKLNERHRQDYKKWGGKFL